MQKHFSVVTQYGIQRLTLQGSPLRAPKLQVDFQIAFHGLVVRIERRVRRCVGRRKSVPARRDKRRKTRRNTRRNQFRVHVIVQLLK